MDADRSVDAGAARGNRRVGSLRLSDTRRPGTSVGSLRRVAADAAPDPGTDATDAAHAARTGATGRADLPSHALASLLGSRSWWWHSRPTRMDFRDCRARSSSCAG